MFAKRALLTLTIFAASASMTNLWAGDLKITIPERSRLTPVQRLNREGVEALQKHNDEKAEQFFYKAYLLDPEDPFTLNNLGYISELKGQVDRAAQFYELARQQSSEAVVAQATSKVIQGRSIKEALALPDSLEINHENVEAVRLLSQGRAPEADLLLQGALKSHPDNVFALNNMGVAKEMEGESQEALKYYDEATAAGSNASAIVTLNRAWRGKPVAQIAQQNGRALRDRLAKEDSRQAQVAELNLRGVSAINRNEMPAAEKDFQRAYALDPNNAFARNNIGYLSELNGDRETAEVFYDSAREAAGAVNVGLATIASAQGQKLTQVAADNDAKVERKVDQEREERRRERAPVVLRRRDNSIVDESATPATSAPVEQKQSPQ